MSVEDDFATAFQELLMQSSIVMINLNILVWQQCPACSSARKAHLFLYSKCVAATR
ncbi:MAG: hypothetical protein ACK4P4_04505 [Allorhizobium sp.]